mmetsp:Transcript_19491/g.34778  ORF Transcript_19491/g.34778 Transcript_19491/m.34778 type:complete len:220 (+) Transcript_19491:2280-2939(+)
MLTNSTSSSSMILASISRRALLVPVRLALLPLPCERTEAIESSLRRPEVVSEAVPCAARRDIEKELELPPESDLPLPVEPVASLIAHILFDFDLGDMMESESIIFFPGLLSLRADILPPSVLISGLFLVLLRTLTLILPTPPLSYFPMHLSQTLSIWWLESDLLCPFFASFWSFPPLSFQPSTRCAEHLPQTTCPHAWQWNSRLKRPPTFLLHTEHSLF